MVSGHWIGQICIALYISYGIAYAYLFGAYKIFWDCILAALVILIGFATKKAINEFLIASMYVIILGCSWFAGGAKSPILFWVFPVQIAATYLGLNPTKQVLICSGLILISLSIYHQFPFPSEVPNDAVSLIHIMALFGILFTAYIFSREFFKSAQKDKALAVQGKQIETMQMMVKGINHEFNNIINAINQGVRAIKNQLALKNYEKVEEVTKNIQSAIVHAENISRSFQDSDFKEEIKEFNIFKMVDLVIKITKGMYMENTMVHNEIRPSQVITSNETVVFQAILNIFLNALAANPSNIKLRFHENDASFNIEIEDDGDGIQPGMDPFIAGVSSKNSSGLGLAISKDNLGSIGGDIILKSRGKPTSFVVSTPKKIGKRT